MKKTTMLKITYISLLFAFISLGILTHSGYKIAQYTNKIHDNVSQIDEKQDDINFKNILINDLNKEQILNYKSGEKFKLDDFTETLSITHNHFNFSDVSLGNSFQVNIKSNNFKPTISVLVSSKEDLDTLYKVHNSENLFINLKLKEILYDKNPNLIYELGEINTILSEDTYESIDSNYVLVGSLVDRSFISMIFLVLSLALFMTFTAAIQLHEKKSFSCE